MMLVPPSRSQLRIALVPPKVRVPASSLIKLLSTEEVMAPPRVRLPLAGVSMISPLLQAILRLTVWVTVVAGFPLKPRLPVNVTPLPPSMKAPAAASNVRLFTVMPARLLLFANCLLPAKSSAVGKLGAVFQLPPVPQLLSDPSPVQVDGAGGVALTSTELRLTPLVLTADTL